MRLGTISHRRADGWRARRPNRADEAAGAREYNLEEAPGSLSAWLSAEVKSMASEGRVYALYPIVLLESALDHLPPLESSLVSGVRDGEDGVDAHRGPPDSPR
jgi:hypothetical protein